MLQHDKITVAVLQRLESAVQELSNTNSITDKVRILKLFPDLKKVLSYIYNPYITFGITWDKIVEKCGEIAPKQVTSDLYKLLDMLANRSLSGYDAYAAVLGFMEIYYRHKEIIGRVINQELKTRTGAKLVNKAFPMLIPEFHTALAYDYNEHKHKVNFETDDWFMSRKMNGVRVITICKGKEVKFYSREGREFLIFGKLKEVLEAQLRKMDEDYPDEQAFDGEMCLIDDKGKDDFKGIVSAIHRKGYTIPNARYCLFDTFPLCVFKDGRGTMKWSQRQVALKSLVNTLGISGPYFRIVDQHKVTSEEMMMKNLDRATELGWEGLIIRKDVGFNGKRSTDLLKVKKFKDAEFVVKAVENGPFRIIDKSTGLETVVETLSAIKVEYKGNVVSVGSGFTLDERKKYYDHPNLIVGKTVTVRYFDESEDKNHNKSLQFPTLYHIWEGERDV